MLKIYLSEIQISCILSGNILLRAGMSEDLIGLGQWIWSQGCSLFGALVIPAGICLSLSRLCFLRFGFIPKWQEGDHQQLQPLFPTAWQTQWEKHASFSYFQQKFQGWLSLAPIESHVLPWTNHGGLGRWSLLIGQARVMCPHQREW